MDRIRILDGTALKLIAMVSMVLDHVGDMFFPGQIWMRVLGRIAMPLFAFCVAEGYCHTRNKGKYLTQLGIFALITELPFDLAVFGRLEFTHQNIMLSFFLAVLALMLYDAIREKMGKLWGRALGCLTVLGMSIVSILVAADYHVFAVLGVFCFYVLRGCRYPVPQAVGVGFLAVTRTIGYYIGTGLSILPLLLYNGKRGRGLKWLFYAFYPGHLLVLYLIQVIVR